MSKFKANFTLKQHTPIIHFQSDQIGATLRATELKPKFDKFLIAEQDGALDYKVKIDKVDTIHKRLKSGINFKSYHKFLLFKYMCTKNIRWEKRKIKQEFTSLATGNLPII